MDFNVKQFCWEHTRISPKNIIVCNIKITLIPSILRGVVYVTKTSTNVRFLNQYLASN